MIISQVWNGKEFVNTDSDTVDGFHANELVSSGANFTKNVFSTGYNAWKFIATTATNTFNIPTNIFDNTKVEEIYDSSGKRIDPINGYNIVGNKVVLKNQLQAQDYVIVYIIDTSYSYTDLLNAPNVGSLASLVTAHKTSIVGAINELYQNNATKTALATLEATLRNDLAPKAHTHHDLYYTESEIDYKLNAKSNSNHTHTSLPLGKSGISNFVGNSSARTIAHGLGAAPRCVIITPNENASGTTGEYWATFDATNLYVYNTGSSTKRFHWFVM